MNPVQKFEKAIAEYLEVSPESVICCNSGTSALIATLLGFGIENRLVFTTPFSFPATTNSILLTGNTPHFIDVDNDGILDFSRIPITKDNPPPSLLYATLFGNIKVPKRTSNYEAVIIDAAQSFFPSIHWKEVDAVTFSFYKTKQISTFEGGAILCNDNLTNKRIRAIINQGQTKPWKFEYLGYNFRMPEILAEIGYSALTTNHFASTKSMSDGYYPFLIPELPYMRSKFFYSDDLSNAKLLVKRIDNESSSSL